MIWQDKLIGVQQGTTGHLYCADDFGEDHVNALPNGATAVQALLQGKVDCVVIDQEPAKAFVEANEGLKILDTAVHHRGLCSSCIQRQPGTDCSTEQSTSGAEG